MFRGGGGVFFWTRCSSAQLACSDTEFQWKYNKRNNIAMCKMLMWYKKISYFVNGIVAVTDNMLTVGGAACCTWHNKTTSAESGKLRSYCQHSIRLWKVCVTAVHYWWLWRTPSKMEQSHSSSWTRHHTSISFWTLWSLSHTQKLTLNIYPCQIQF